MMSAKQKNIEWFHLSRVCATLVSVEFQIHTAAFLVHSRSLE